MYVVYYISQKKFVRDTIITESSDGFVRWFHKENCFLKDVLVWTLPDASLHTVCNAKLCNYVDNIFQV